MRDVYRDILAHVDTLEIIDTHEHLPGTEDSRPRPTDVLAEYLTHYFSRDLVSAGLPSADYQRALDHTQPLMERWALVEPYWEHARHTGYGRALDISARGLYGIDGVSRNTIEPLNERFLASLAPGHYRYVLQEKSKIRVGLLQMTRGPVDETFFRRITCLDGFIYPRTWDDIRLVEEESGVRITGFDDWLEACEATFATLPGQGTVALKSALAYDRSLHYDRVTRAEAEEGFNHLFRVRHFPDWTLRSFEVPKPFQDYMMHFVLRLANRSGCAFQFHTGLQEGNGNLIANSDPALLSSLFLDYPDVKFDLFHMGYPYQQTASALAKTFPNVFIDMCWAHIISPTASVNALVEWLDAVPANKISAFGGDYCFVDAVYGHQCLARENVSRALATKVTEGVFDADRACRIAEMLLFDNPVAIFGLQDRL